MPPKQKDRTAHQSGIIATVQTPLGFFTLVVLVVEGILGGTAWVSPGTDRSHLITGMIAIMLLLIFIVAGMALWRPRSLYGAADEAANRGISLVILAPEVPPDLRGLDITRIDWAQGDCHLVIGSRREPIRLVPDRVGAAFHVEMPKGLPERFKDISYLELDLKDQKGNRWFVKPFPPYQQLLRLSTRESASKIVADYGDEGA